MKADGREYGERILDYEGQLAEYFNAKPKATGKTTSGNQYTGKSGKSTSEGTFTKGRLKEAAELGFTRDEYLKISKLTPEAIEAAKAQARYD
jgi:hypothetical protein